MTRVRLHLVLLLLVCGLLAGPAHAVDGIVLIAPLGGGFDPRSATYDLDGNIVIAGVVKNSVNSTWGHSFLTIRVLPDGTLDPAFGDGGIVLTNVAVNRYDGANTCAVQPDGKVISAGCADNNKKGDDFALVRYHPDGSLDKTFNKKGIVTTHFGANEWVYDVAVQDDGKILATGEGPDFLTARYTAKGLLDASFGQGGYVRTLFESRTAYAHRVMPSADGILVAGHASSPSCFALARYHLNGNLDGSFGAGGTLFLTRPGFDSSYFGASVLDATSRILIGGHSTFFDDDGVYYSEWTIARLTRDGSLDDTFGELDDVEVPTGFVGLDLGGWEHVTALAVQGNGKIVAAGYHDSVGGRNLVVARFNEDGSLDTDFGNNGWTEQPVGYGENMEPVAVLIEPDGKILVVAPLYIGGDPYCVGLLRYLPDGTLDPDF